MAAYTPGIDFSAAATTASFSTGLIEHVEYTMRPPFFNIRMARWRMRSCRLSGADVSKERIVFRRQQRGSSISRHNNNTAFAPVQPVPVHRRPVLPYAWVLAQRAVAAARHVAEDAVEEELVLFFRGNAGLGARGERGLLRRDLDSREN